ncbi:MULTISPECIES: hypothetical protein [unclassified Nitrobacter]|uniref:hypothetical protein n=1 Tax=unclassified Nitrobacter TaxID=2620411 RepID=UPI0003258B07|nr:MULTISPECIES: hypothetical protein [unclassified Nitrobacter]MCB1392408.1 hypothetical protein [Nitrobacter sp.]MCV0387697.1 hypothetical protein [Nitrobacter sp.]
MSQFSSEFTRMLSAALDDAALQIQSDSSTKAFMAEQILKAAAKGVYRRKDLTDIAVRAARMEALVVSSETFKPK